MKIRAGLLGLLVLAAACLGVADAKAETFLLADGESLEGTIISSIGNTISIKLAGRGMRQLPVNAIDQIEVTLPSGEQVVGKLIGWSRDAFEILAGDRRLRISGGEIVTDVAADSQKDVETPTNGVGGPRLAVANPDDPLDDEASIENPPPAADSSALPDLLWSTSPTSEDAGEVVVSFSLSKTINKPIVVIYSAMDRTATSGADYEKAAGVLTIKAGSSDAEVRIPVIDDDQKESDEEFGIFLSVDPRTVRADSRNIVVTIEDNDL